MFKKRLSVHLPPAFPTGTVLLPDSPFAMMDTDTHTHIHNKHKINYVTPTEVASGDPADGIAVLCMFRCVPERAVT